LYVGVDLAWGTRAATGLAAVAEDGSLVGSATVRTDDDVVAWVGSLGRDPVVVALDAPLVVTNPSGMRECERLVARAFGAHGASCHPSSRARPVFDPPRAEVLARRCGWSTDPWSSGGPGAPVAIEVYPHAAMVGLFSLGSVLPYKAKPGRSVDLRRAALLEVLHHLETVPELRLEEHPRWLSLRAAVVDATRHVHLERVEDEVDAVLCAHLAWLWAHRRDGLQVYGDPDGPGDRGFIVAPPPPAHPPWRRRVEPAALTSP
jgi:predicted RNase H-like nuclease